MSPNEEIWLVATDPSPLRATRPPVRECPSCRSPGESLVCGACGARLPPVKGDRLDGKWEIVSRLGGGAMGSVFLARDLSLDRLVAVKLLGSGDTRVDDALRERFEAEARALARLDHPNVVPVYAFGHHGDIPFLVMKRMGGRTLETLIAERGGRLEIDELLTLWKQLASGLEALHDCGLVHRDVKPANLMVTDDGTLVIIDLGIVRDQKRAAVTVTGMTVGSPRYMSPEQVRGERDLDHRSDLYSLGIVTFEALTGQVVFDGTNDFAVMSAHLEKPPRRASTMRVGLSAAVDGVLARALAKTKQARPSSASEFYGELREALRSRPRPVAVTVEQRAYTPPSRVPRWAPNLVVGLLALACTSGSLIGGGGVELTDDPPPSAGPGTAPTAAAVPSPLAQPARIDAAPQAQSESPPTAAEPALEALAEEPAGSAPDASPGEAAALALPIPAPGPAPAAAPVRRGGGDRGRGGSHETLNPFDE